MLIFYGILLFQQLKYLKTLGIYLPHTMTVIKNFLYLILNSEQ